MIYSGISHLADQHDAFFLEDGRLYIRIRTARHDVTSVILHTRDKYIPIELKDTSSSYKMTHIGGDFAHDYFAVKLPVDMTDAGNPRMLCLRYFFEITDCAGAKIYYGDSWFFTNRPGEVEDMFDCPLISRRAQTFCIPDWAKNAVVYQIFPSRFATTKNVPDEKWYQTPVTNETDLMGNLSGIISKLGYLKELGCDCIYMTPIFRSDTAHKYDTIDYYCIDPSFGNDNDLKNLVEASHSMGMKVILDGVFNHTSTKFFAFRDIIEKGRESKYFDWYYIDGDPSDYGSESSLPGYQSFAYFGGMPKLRVENPEVADYITDVCLHYIRNFHIDGWRLDVGDEISHSFWKKLRARIKAENKDALLVGEVWHFAPDFLMGDEWDSVMNYTFYKATTSMLCGGCLRPSEFMSELAFLKGNYQSAVIPVLWNLIDSHDTPRFLTMAENDKRRLMLAASLQMLLPGTPFIYYGDEVGMEGGMDPDNRRGMYWDNRADMDIYRWYQRLTYFRHTIHDITAGNYSSVSADDEKNFMKFFLKSGEILIFHTTGDETSEKEYEGYKELLSDRIFNGLVEPYQTILLSKN